MQKILITGGSGLVGKQLTKLLLGRGYVVTWLTRKINTDLDIRQLEWNPNKRIINKEAFDDVSIVVNLSGASVGAKRWTQEWKKEIYDSRVTASEFLIESINLYGKQVNTIISSSATGYYGALTSTYIFSEPTLAGADFLANTCVNWENALLNSNTEATRKVIIRTGIVLCKEGGALTKLYAPFKIGLGAPLGSGKQYFSWIHLDDICAIFIKAIEDISMSGIYNAVAPTYSTNREFTVALGQALKAPIWAPLIPAFILKAILGELADGLLHGSRISAKKIIEAGYHFNFPNIELALANIYKK